MKASGISVFCCEIAASTATLGHDVRLLVNHSLPEEYPVPPSIQRLRALNECNAWKPDIIHIHGLWLPFFFKTFCWAKRHKIRVVWSPHGCLSPWSLRYKGMKKRLAWWLYQRWALQNVTALHATTPLETNDIRAQHLTPPVVELPLGIHAPHASPRKSTTIPKTALFLSFIHRKKGLIDLIDAWANLQPNDWQLIIAGSSNDNYIEQVKQYAEERHVKALFTGEVFGDEKESLLTQADLFLLPSYSENFGVVVLEALAHGTPVLTTTATPWESLPKNHCGWWIPPGYSALEAQLKTIFKNVPRETLHTMGQNGRTMVLKDYAWPTLATRLVQHFQSLI